MQSVGHLYDTKTKEKILCLVRQCKYGRQLKLRTTGRDGFHLTDEEIFLNLPEQKSKLENLKNGHQIYC